MPRSSPTEAAAARPEGPIELLALEFGTYPEVVPLNRRFRPGHRLLKLTLDVHAGAAGRGTTPGAASHVEALQKLLPTLARHTCCGDARLAETLFVTGRGRATCTPGENDDRVDLAHLLEHLIIDFTHGIADMRACSGVTCGYQSPPHRFDVFVESPDDRVSRLCVSLAADLTNRIAGGGNPDPFYAKVVRLARHVYRGAGPVSAASAHVALEGDPQALGALLTLAEMGFLREIEASMNFSGAPIYAIARSDGDRS